MSEYHRLVDLTPLVTAKVEEARAAVSEFAETVISDYLIAQGWKPPAGDAPCGDVAEFLSYPPLIRSEMLDLGKAMVELEVRRQG